MNEFIQTTIVCLIVLWSVWLTIKRYLPNWLYAQQLQLANYCQQHKYSVLANWLKPAMAVKTSCNSGCSGCSQACPSTQSAEQIVKFVHK